MEVESLVQTLLPGVGTMLLAVLSGAGGSALLELYYKPRRDRKRAASMLLAEILCNTELALLQTRVRKSAPRSIAADFSFSRIGWDAAAPTVNELPPDVVKQIVLLYVRYKSCNEAVRIHRDYLDELNALPKKSPGREAELNKVLDSTIDAFNVGLDKAIGIGKLVLPELVKHAQIKVKKNTAQPLRDYDKVVESFLSERRTRLDALQELERPESGESG